MHVRPWHIMETGWIVSEAKIPITAALLGITVGGARTVPHHCPKTRLSLITPDVNFQPVNNKANAIDSYPCYTVTSVKYYRDLSISPEPCDILYTVWGLGTAWLYMGTSWGQVVLGVCDCGLKFIEVSYEKPDGPSAWTYERAQPEPW